MIITEDVVVIGGMSGLVFAYQRLPAGICGRCVTITSVTTGMAGIVYW